MGREQLTVLEEAGPASTCALFSPQCRGLLRREGDFLAHAQSKHTAGAPFALGGGFLAPAHCYYSIAESALRLRQLGSF